MKRFTLHQKIKVISGVLRGRNGIVVRERRCDDGAWVEMEDRMPTISQPFPFPLNDSRANHTLLYPEDCEASK